MMLIASEVIARLAGKTLVTAESCTGGGIGAALTSVPGSSRVYKGGIICYTNWVKTNLLGVESEVLDREGAVSSRVAEKMAAGVMNRLDADVAVSVTGLAGPDGDEFGNPVGTVFIGYADADKVLSRHCYFEGTREEIREQAITAARHLVLTQNAQNNSSNR